jgi:hypothetical protein
MPRKSQPELERSKLLSQLKAEAQPVTLHLPPAHPKQLELINAFDARKNTGAEFLCTKCRDAQGKPLVHTSGDVLYGDDQIASHPDWPLAFPELRFIVGACGTKFGKTYGCSIKLVKEAWRNWDYVLDQPLDHPGLFWWVAPSYKQAKNAFKLVMRLLPPGMYKAYKNNNEIKIELLKPDGSVHSTIDFRSAENYDTLRGEEVSFFVFDECARGVNQEAYISVMTTVTKTLGRGIFISTPNGRTWFFDLYRQGEPGEGREAEWLSIRMPTWTNPHVPIKAIEHLRKNMSKEQFEQEVAGRFMTNSAGVFNHIDMCVKGVLGTNGQPLFEAPVEGRRYVIGADLARKRDFTVLIVVDRKTKRVVYFERFNQTDWTTQKARIVRLSAMYNHATVCMDATGLGDVVHSDLQKMGVPTEPYIISSSSKEPLIDKLRVAIEFQRITFPQIAVLIKELRDYEFEINAKTGHISYQAPPGANFHDDCVVALALANWVVQQPLFKYRGLRIRGI